MQTINEYDYDSLIRELDSIAREVCSYEFGLPIYDAGQMSLLREAVIKWLILQQTNTTIDESAEDPDTLI